MFDAIAARYDLLNRLLSAGIDRRWRRRAIAGLALTGRERVLDLCTGTGDLAIAARRAPVPAARVLGVDFAGAMLRVGQEKLGRLGLRDSVALVQGDASCLPVSDQSVHAITVGFGIRNVEHAEDAVAEMYRALAPGGRLAILEFAIPSAPVIRHAYRWYFNSVLPRIGRLVSRHQAAYRYLPASVSAFSSPEEFMTLLRRLGFSRVSATPLTFGIVYLFTASRE